MEKIVDIIINNKTKLINPPDFISDTVIERLTFANPKYAENATYGRWNGDTPEFLDFYELNEYGDIVVPRGFTNQLVSLCSRYRILFDIQDNTRSLPEIDFKFNGTLRPFQKLAMNDVLNRQFATLAAPTGSGKTIMALYAIAQRKQPTLVIVHSKELLNQWIDRIETFLEIPADEVGVIGSGKMRISDKITVALVQTLYKVADDVFPYIGHLIVDECHRAPSRTFTEAVTAFDSKYMLALSATPWRRDKLSRLIYYFLGDVAHEVKKQGLLKTGDIVPVEVITRETEFQSYHDPSEEYSKMLKELTEDYDRNRMIVSDVAKAASNGSGICLVLSDRKAHVYELSEMLDGMCSIQSAVLTGDLPTKDREATVEALNAGETRVLLATGQLVGEGFDLKELSTLFLATPIKFDGRVTQYLGRVLRPAPGKDKARVFDYVDSNIGVLQASAKSRQRVFKELKK